MSNTSKMYGFSGFAAVCVLMCLVSSPGAVPREGFLPFGTSAGDTRLSVSDDGSSQLIPLNMPFAFFGVSHETLTVNNNGNITFDGPLSDFTPFAFPSDFQIIAPYFADVDTQGTSATIPFDIADDGFNDVYYSERTNTTDLDAITAVITRAFGEGLPIINAFVATWDHVGYFSGNVDLLNTFQVVLATDGVETFVIFNYLDDGMTWETGDASGGSGGFGGTQASAGFDAGNSADFFTIPGSRLAGIAEVVERGTNVGVPGQWVFQVTGQISAPQFLVGDININGMRDAEDAQVLLAVLVGLVPSAVLNFAAIGDMNADGQVTNLDAALILGVSTGRIPPPPDNRLVTVMPSITSVDVTVAGSADAVPPGSTVRLTNARDGSMLPVAAASDGSFRVDVAAFSGDTLFLDVDNSPARIGVRVGDPLLFDPPLPLPEVPICGDEDSSTSPPVLNCPDFIVLRDAQIFRVPGSGPVSLTFDFVFSTATARNEFGVFRVDDPAATINGVQPQDAGYFMAIASRAIVVLPRQSTPVTPDVTLAFNGGDLLVFFLIQDDTVANFFANNPDNDLDLSPLAFTSGGAFNPDGVDHFVAFANIVDGFTQIGFEDGFDEGERTFSDVVVNITPALLSPVVAP